MTNTNEDVNDIFNDILFCEENLTKVGYEDGKKAGSEEGSVEGFHLGYHRGAQIGAELGYYLGTVNIHLSDNDNQPGLYGDKIIKQLKKVEEAVKSIPLTNCPETDIIGQLEQVRAHFRHLCSLLRLNNPYSSTPAISF